MPDDSTEQSGVDTNRSGSVAIDRRETVQAIGAGVAAVGLLGGDSTQAAGAQAGVSDDFFDNFEDGDFDTAPEWEMSVTQGNFSARVVDQESPEDSSRSLSLVETTIGGTDGVINWTQGRTGWDGEWTLSGLYYTESLNTDEQFQTQMIPIYIPTDGVSNKFEGPLNVVLGFSDGDRNTRPFRITGDLIESEEQTHDPGWEQGTWYNYEIHHDGDGTYTGRLWQPDEPRPAEPQARSVGDPPGTEPRVAGILANGANREPFEMRHDYMRWETGGGGGIVDDAGILWLLVAAILGFGGYVYYRSRRSNNRHGQPSRPIPEPGQEPPPQRTERPEQQGHPSQPSRKPRQQQPAQRTGRTGQREQSSQPSRKPRQQQPARRTDRTGQREQSSRRTNTPTGGSTRLCPNCGEMFGVETGTCTNCGTELTHD